MDLETTSSDIYEHNKILIYNNTFLLIMVLILLLIIFFYDIENTESQKYLYNIYKNNIDIKNKYGSIINPNLKVNKINDKMFLVEDLLNIDYFNYLKSQFINKKYKTIDIYFRKGNGINFRDLHKSTEYNGLLELYYSDEIIKLVSNVIGKNVQRTPLSDNNSCSLLIYSNKGDYIDWHKDYSNYYGDRYVVLLSLINNNIMQECCSENEFMYEKQIEGEDENINKVKMDLTSDKIGKLKLKPNNLLIFKGSEILHKSTEIGFGEKRILLSMTFCDICLEKKNIVNILYESVKNNSLYG
jgi:hypothetical protein